MACAHDGFHSIGTSYDRRRGVLVYFWTCERCGARLRDARRERYRPSYVPRGYERFPSRAPLTAAPLHGLEADVSVQLKLAHVAFVEQQVHVPEHLGYYVIVRDSDDVRADRVKPRSERTDHSRHRQSGRPHAEVLSALVEDDTVGFLVPSPRRWSPPCMTRR